MVEEELLEFSKEFHDEIRAEAHAIEALREEIFVQKMGDILEDYGEIESLIPCSHKGHGLKVDGYGFDDEFKDLTLVVSYYADSDGAKITNREIDRYFSLVTNFLKKARGKLYESIELSLAAHDLARLLYDCRKDIRNVKLVLITDGIAQKRPAELDQVDGIDITKIVWDIERTCHFHRTGEREKIKLNFTEHCNGPLPCVLHTETATSYTTYLAFIPGSALADMYGKWGIRMLDMNVRVFLSARGNVNKGIRDTIRNEPAMFCAYNNGITVFARNVQMASTERGLVLLSAEDFQIVNGGQTTASLFHTRKNYGADLSHIRVQMKLTALQDEELIDTLVPKISLYSNLQNKVQLADLAANESPHPEIQAISKALLAPDPTGGSFQTYWFYERARGSYEEYRNLTARTAVQRREFDRLRPKNQKFDKIKFGKVWNSYLRLPHLVSLGGQKNFARFNEWLREQKGEDWTAFFRKTVALLILWNETEKLVRRQQFGGYQHIIAAYSLSLLHELTECRLDLDKIWKNQSVGDAVRKTVEMLTHTVNAHIRQTRLDIGEYAKKEECWKALKEAAHPSLPHSLEEDFMTGAHSPYTSDLHSEQEAVLFCSEKGSDAWFALAKWLKDRDFLTPKARSQSFNMGKILSQGRQPSTALSKPCKKIWEDACIRGWDG